VCKGIRVVELTVHFSADGDRSVLQLTGELDLDSVRELRQHARAELAGRRCRVLTIDMSGLTFIDSTGLGLLVELRNLAGTTDATVELANVPSGLARIIAIAGLAETFGLPPSADAADG
jgi:anti-sigma B factor antagonist